MIKTRNTSVCSSRTSSKWLSDSNSVSCDHDHSETASVVSGEFAQTASGPPDQIQRYFSRKQCLISAMSKRFSFPVELPQQFRYAPLLQLAVLLFLLMGSCNSAQAQGLSFSNEMQFGNAGEIVQTQGQQSASYSIGAREPDYYSINGNPNQSSNGDRGFGWWGRTGYDTGPALGREESLLFFETMPYLFWEETMFLSDLRLWRLNSGRLGGNVGVGVRRYVPAWDRSFGAIMWYDLDATFKDDFQATTISLESRGQHIDWLANIYLPFDVRRQQIGLDFATDSQRFAGNNILFDQIRTSGYALKGFDMEIGAPVGIEFARQFDMRAYAGFYRFDHPDLDSLWGWKARLEANVAKYLDLNLALTDDKTFDTRVSFSASWTIDPAGEAGERANTWDRMLLPPTRLWTIPKAEVAVLEAGNVVINPVTGVPLRVLHVNNNPVLNPGVNAPGAGTVTTPFDTIENAVNGINAPGIDTYDILYVHSGSVYDNEPTIVVPEGKRYLGGGDRVEHRIAYNNFTTARLPRAIGNYRDHATTPDTTFDPRPVFTNLGNPAGPGVTFNTLAALGGTVTSNTLTEFSGFVVGDPNYAAATTTADTWTNFPLTTPVNGTFGNGIEFVDLPTPLTQVRFVDLHGSRGNGLDFTNTSDTYNLEALVVNQSQNHEMFVSGGAPNITFQSSTRGGTGSRVDSLVINRANALAVIAPDGAGTLGDNSDLAVTGTTGGSINWIDVITDDDGGDGFIFTGGAQSNVTIPVSTTIANSRGNGIAIFENTGGNYLISASRTDFVIPNSLFTTIAPTPGTPLVISNPAFNAIQIGRITPAIATTNARVNFVEDVNLVNLSQTISGLFVANTTGDITFTSSEGPMLIDYTVGAVGTASGIEFFQNFQGDLTFNNAVAINNAGGAGIRITNDDNIPVGSAPGVFRFTGASPGLRIDGANANQGATGAAIVIGTDPPAGVPNNNLIPGTGYESLVEFANPVTIENRNGMGLWAANNTGDIRFQGANSVFNAPGSLLNAGSVSVIRLENNIGTVAFTQVNIETGTNPIIGYADDDDPTALELANTFAAIDMRTNTGEIRLGELNLGGVSEGVFGINNRRISISGGTIEMVDGTGLDIFTTDAVAIVPTNSITRVDIELDTFNNGTNNTPDYALHLANVKGSLTVLSGSIGDVVGVGIDRTENVTAGAKFDNSELRALETVAGLNFYGSSRSFSATLGSDNDQGGLDFTDNIQGVYADSIDSLRVTNSAYDTQAFEAIELINVPRFQVTGSDFADNQDGPGGTLATTTFATIRSTMDRALNDQNAGLDGEPTLYDFVVGPRNTDFRNSAPDEQNTFDETGSNFSILLDNQAVNNAVGVPNNSFFDSETGLIVNNSTFTSSADATTAIRGYIRYFDNANSIANINIAMNEMLGADDNFDVEVANTDLGAISIEHNSLATENDDNLTFNAIDNRIVLEENFSTAFRVVDTGDGDSFIRIGDTNNDALTEGGSILNDNIQNPDIEVADTDQGIFYFDLETDSTVEIADLEIHVIEDEEGLIGGGGTIDAQTVFLFDNVSGTTSIDISGNTILFEDLGATVNPVNGFIGLVNDMQVVQFNAVSGNVTLSSNIDNPVGVNIGGAIFLLTNPAILFQAPNSANFNGQFRFNNVFVP